MYRQSALESLSSGNELDRLMRVTGPRSWLILLGVAAVTVAAVIWAILAVLPATVSASGALVSVPYDSHIRQAAVFATLEQEQDLQDGQMVTVRVPGVPGARPLSLRGRVIAVDPMPANRAEMVGIVRDPVYARSLATAGRVLLVRIGLLGRPNATLTAGMICHASITVSRQSPIRLILP